MLQKPLCLWVAALVVLTCGWAPTKDEIDLGTNRGTPIETGFFFYHGKYIEAPYVVERRGGALYINDILLYQSREWPPYDETVNTDPGDPPKGFGPLDPIPKGVDPRDTYWARKWRYLVQHYDNPDTVRALMFAAYKNSDRVKDAKRDDELTECIRVTDVTGKTTLMDGHVHPSEPWTRERIIGERERQKSRLEGVLKHGGALMPFSSCEIELDGGPDKMIALLDVLLSSATREEKAKALAGPGVFVSIRKVVDELLDNFQSGSQIAERYNALKKAAAEKEAAEEKARADAEATHAHPAAEKQSAPNGQRK